MGKPRALPEGGIKINGVEFVARTDTPYLFDYAEVVRRINDEKDEKKRELVAASYFRKLVLNDLWFVVYFVLRVKIANHPFWVQACNLVQSGPKSMTVDKWPREHGKTTIISIAETIQRLCADSEEHVAIFSYIKSAAISILRSIKQVLETSEFLMAAFPDVLYRQPAKQSWGWSEDRGLWLKRYNTAKEANLEAHGLIEGMPTGKHFTDMRFDDIETFDLVQTPESLERCKDAFDMAQNLGTYDGTKRVTGTPYSYEGTIEYVSNKRGVDGKRLWTTRTITATLDGTFNGKSAYLPEPKLAELRVNRQHFYSQQLCDPTPIGEAKLDKKFIKKIKKEDLPANLYRFMAVDSAGNNKGGKGDSWGIALIGVQPYLDDIGASNIYILNLCIQPMTWEEAIKTIANMYIGGGRILRLGVEKASLSTTEIHVQNALRARGKYVNQENGTLVLLNPAGRRKETRIESILSWPLNNGKVHMCDSVPIEFQDRLGIEMTKFPYWHEDGLDSLAWAVELTQGYKFPKVPGQVIQDEEEMDNYERAFRDTIGASKSKSWMGL